MIRANGYWQLRVARNRLFAPQCIASMADLQQRPLLDLDEHAALRTILEGTATETGERFFSALVENLAKALGTHGAMVTRYEREQRRLYALAFCLDGRFVPDFVFDLEGTPCERVVDSRQLVHFGDQLVHLFPDAPGVRQAGLVSYLGMPLLDVDDTVLGHMAVVDRRPLPNDPRVVAIFRIFAARAAAELQRLHREAEIRQREEKLGRLVDSAMDAILELDRGLRLTRMNVAAEKVFSCAAADVVGGDFGRFLAADSRRKLERLIDQLDAHPEGERYLWIPGGLTARPCQGDEFPAEATLSRFEMNGQSFYTLILRDVNDRLQAEQKIQSLTVQAEYLKEEIKELHNFDEIVGRSPALLGVLKDIEQVAPTDATVLILGETGTGKELLARAIHAASPRSAGPLIKVNCAAIPANLIESEFFGHVKGAFTGATQAREGRFALADGGTIFLDEIGDLPIDLQMKLLRVLQEGEFEPVGSSKTVQVDVRILAATNRDLQQAIRDGEFREDLYYRLNVFPIDVPPLRDRGDDVVLLAAAFASRFAQKMGRALEPLTEACAARLKAYAWPGNVRELENVIERAVITALDGRLNLDRALPEPAAGRGSAAQESSPAAPGRVRTVQQLQEDERANILLALESADWRVAGDGGAAQMLGMNPSTLNSRMRSLGIKRPR